MQRRPRQTATVSSHLHAVPSRPARTLPVGEPLEPQYESLNGSWILDKMRSQQMVDYLQCMGVDELAIEAQTRSEMDSETRNVMLIDGSRYTIAKRTKINNLCEMYELGRDRVVRCRNGTRVTTVVARERGQEDCVIATTTMPTPNGQLRLVETRALVEEGLVMSQHLDVTNTTTGGKSMTQRIWLRVPVTEEDQQSLLEETAPNLS